MTDVGARVWVIRDQDPDVIHAYGFGVYEGDHLMPGWDNPGILAICAEMIRKGDTGPPIIDPHVYFGRKVDAGELTAEQAAKEIARVEAADAAEKARPVAERALELARLCSMNPRIRLDSGHTVWGAECWWVDADDDTPAKYAAGRRIVAVTPADNRRAAPEVP